MTGAKQSERVCKLKKVCFKMGFERRERGYVTDVWWEGVPEVRGRATKGSKPHGSQSEMDRGRRPESVNGCVDVQRGTAEQAYGLP